MAFSSSQGDGALENMDHPREAPNGTLVVSTVGKLDLRPKWR
jgi:hypothetical protein